MFKLVIHTDNAAFGDSVMEHGAELARILRDIANRLEGGSIAGSARDMNGNNVGGYLITNNPVADNWGIKP